MEVNVNRIELIDDWTKELAEAVAFSRAKPLKEFFADIRNFEVGKKYRGRNSRLFVSAHGKIYSTKGVSKEYTDNIKFEKNGEKKTIKHFVKDNIDGKEILFSACLSLDGENGTFTVKTGNDKEKYTFVYKNKKISKFKSNSEAEKMFEKQ